MSMKTVLKEKTKHTMREKNKLHERMCVACGIMREKEALVRIMRSGDGFSIDPGKKAGGRGAYVCADPACVERMCRKRLLNRAFRTAVQEEEYQKLQEDFQRIYG